MDSQASLSQASQDSIMTSSELSRPATPKLQHASSSGSPGTDHLVKAASPDRVKFTSPAPPTTSSLTPPPSSQIPNTRASVRTPTPPTPQLTSPPPTFRLPNQPSGLAESSAVMFSQDQVNNAPADELRSMVNELSSAFRDVRLSAAHYKLQYNMAVMESQEAASRMAVELAMAQRELDVLQQAEEKRRSTIVSPAEAFQESPSIMGTPHRSTPRRMHQVPLSNANSRGQNNFEALLLADKMLSQETATAPSTPARSHAPKSRFGHNRATHSLSSLPQTPNRRSAHPHTDVPRTPPTFAAVNIPQSAPPAHYQPKAAHIRRESSNSTITASSVDEEAFTDREEDEDVPESQASQMATSMLRRAAAPSKKMPAPSSSHSASLVQSKIFGQVKKGHGLTRSGELEKRRLHSAEHVGSPPKRGRTDRGVGLGIGGLLRD
ncbi:hypothetical protein BDV95DRAFT_27755 [Massariosphaeria phaeospora]|uniref:Uncharacterized protein n=1 Tax=Massariosphaeria phaeospora TaxID=100035 RepID=A0A7C8MC89_9PLEO|nr:hypothetical protein BDV95DRAFT_27755 [Massariosphaeria phaeospora]